MYTDSLLRIVSLIILDLYGRGGGGLKNLLSLVLITFPTNEVMGRVYVSPDS